MTNLSYALRIGRQAMILAVLVAVGFSTLLTALPANAAGQLDPLEVRFGTSKPATATDMYLQFTTATQLPGDGTSSDDDAFIRIQFPTAGGADPFTLASVAPGNVAVNAGGAVTVNSVVMEDADTDTQNDRIKIGLDLTDGVPSPAPINSATQVEVTITGGKITTPNKVAGVGTADIYPMSIETLNDASAVVDAGSNQVAIIDAVAGQAQVATTLAMSVTGKTLGSECRGDNVNDVTATTTINAGAETLNWGTLVPQTVESACQTVSVTTNSPSGYDLYIVQNGNLTSGGDDIDQYVDGTPTATGSALEWVSPAANAGNENTHGHLGYGSDDAQVFSDTEAFASIPTYTSGAPVVTHKVADNNAAVTGDQTDVEFAIEISAIQNAGTYTHEIYYNLVPKY